MTDSASRAILVAIAGPATGDTFRIDELRAVIGRDEGNSVALPDPSVSRRHCELRRTDCGWTVHDLGSFNGTFLNGESVREAELQDGDRIRAGETEFLFRCQTSRVHEGAAESLRATTRFELHASRYLQLPSLDQPDPRTQRDLQSLVRLGTVVNGLRDRDQVETELLRAAFDAVPATHVAILRATVDSKDFQCVGELVRDGHASSPRHQSATDLAIARKEGVLTKPASLQNNDPPASLDGPQDCVLAVPLCDTDDVIGLLYLAAGGSGVFDEQHLELVIAIAGVGSVALQNVRRFEALEAETEQLKRALRMPLNMTGDSPPMRQVYKTITKVAPTGATVLITGETGTGKELAARAIHASGPRHGRPFIAINCAALPETLLESELFGHERGAFTDANATKKGQFELADGGTLFLDEVGELTPVLQAKLLRVLQQREIQRVGGTRPIAVDIHLIAATNRRLPEEVRAGRFREDLLFRLNVIELEMPPLRKRRGDIPMLASYFLARAAERYGRRALVLSLAAQRCLVAYDWPGNVRELENAIDRAVIMGSSPEIGVDDLPETMVERVAADITTQPRSLHAAVLETKRRVVRAALIESRGRVTDAARQLDLHPNYLHRLLTVLGLRSEFESFINLDD